MHSADKQRHGTRYMGIGLSNVLWDDAWLTDGFCETHPRHPALDAVSDGDRYAISICLTTSHLIDSLQSLMRIIRVPHLFYKPTLNIATALIFSLMQAKSSALVYHTTMTLPLAESLQHSRRNVTMVLLT